ncbi:hypothetical protein G7Y89_g12781 [Cudoniella acicularis]|uniref:Peptidase M24 domain-containing protein n=1 Tax=Cudoniella acicularis TaxID=354080 RepID=A0A8H4RB63_9HELO|nr:hypothetical protein G7Y89_g12781 [Cudoniella acicularis]
MLQSYIYLHVLLSFLTLLHHVQCSSSQAPVPKYQPLPPLREQALLQDTWTRERLSIVPSILKKWGVDAWLMSQREYAEDTVFWSLKPATSFSARRRTVILFLAEPLPGLSSHLYSWIDNTPLVWEELSALLELHDPTKIAVNADDEISFSSGMHAGEMALVREKLGKELAGRLVVEKMVAVEVVATMVEGKLGWYRKLQETAWAMISEAFSEDVIEPGRTSTEDIEWWLREKILQMNYSTWFHPSVNILGPKPLFESPPSGKSNVINYGDLLHVDFGVTALGMNTDTQHMAYVLYPGETESDIPQGYLDGLKKANRLQDIVKSNMKIGLTGNQILKSSLKQMRSEGIEGKVYSHPIGDWGHSAGSLIGMTNMQDKVPVLGDLPLLKNTYYSVELTAEHFVPEINATMNFYLEEDVYWIEDEKRWEWVWGRQEKFHLIHSRAGQGFRVQNAG